jgi:hypothetical protein
MEPAGMEEGPSVLKQMAEKVKQLDFHPKTKPRTVKKTRAGGVGMYATLLAHVCSAFT